jgi:hypothetical protein
VTDSPERGAVRPPYACECLIDQGRIIGGDPVGHACVRPSTRRHPSGRLVCETCFELLARDSPRVTLPPHPLGSAGQERIINEFLKSLPPQDSP